MYHLEIIIRNHVQIIQDQSKKSEIKIPKLPDPSFKTPNFQVDHNLILEKSSAPFKPPPIFLRKGKARVTSSQVRGTFGPASCGSAMDFFPDPAVEKPEVFYGRFVT